MTTTVSEEVEVLERPRPTWLNAAQGFAVLALGLAAAFLGHRLVPQVGVLTWSIGLGVAAANLGVLPRTGTRQLGQVTKKLLRVGIVLLGFSVSFASITALGLPVIAVVAVSLVATLVFTTWLGRRMGLSSARSLLVGTGTAICGASAIAAMEDTARADEEDVTAAIAMVTLFGTLALVLLPLLQGPLGLTDAQFGTWAGASVHEVGQVVAAASPAGAAVVAIAIVVKLARVVMLAPVVAVVSLVQRITRPASANEAGRTPLVPLFVLGFLACVALRSTGLVPEAVLGGIANVQVAALGAALFGMGCSVKVASLLRRSGAVMVVSTLGTLFIGAVSLAGILLVTGR
ncbi:MAG TPA: putative sulfate exporter family transporter [Intrasporangium sp.]|uniref:YeiH family protein n=1 Tax=Intrasporangium sp. TaxID=1925024 RepID=UPI002B463494|nr:putative sulfate exporter family transporter [Intrasporangium sp.]HKX69312.1 putative sulfate exporter family transporter [Intrasporangium sp.]